MGDIGQKLALYMLAGIIRLRSPRVYLLKLTFMGRASCVLDPEICTVPWEGLNGPCATLGGGKEAVVDLT